MSGKLYFQAFSDPTDRDSPDRSDLDNEIVLETHLCSVHDLRDGSDFNEISFRYGLFRFLSSDIVRNQNNF